MALRECKECGKEASTSAETCPHCGVKDPTTPLSQKVVTALIGLLFFGWMCSMLIPDGSTDSDQQSTMSVRDSIENARQDSMELEALKERVQYTVDAVEKARELGFLKKIDNPDRTVYVDYATWAAMNAGQKESAVTVFARYLGYTNDMEQAVGATVKDWQSGRTIAEYSVFSGVSIE